MIKKYSYKTIEERKANYEIWINSKVIENRTQEEIDKRIDNLYNDLHAALLAQGKKVPKFTICDNDVVLMIKSE